jgi:hypothetical protein
MEFAEGAIATFESWTVREQAAGIAPNPDGDAEEFGI